MKSFFDTNILVYLFDGDAPDKQTRAQSLLAQETAAGRILLSTQVLQEFYVTVTRKLATPLPPQEARQALAHLGALTCVNVDANHVLAAADRSQNLQLSFWDALIIESALAGGANRLYTEDLQHGQVIGNLRIENPFLET